MRIYSDKTSRSSDTVFYRVTLEDVIDALEKDKANIWLIAALKEYGWECLNDKVYLWGCKVIDDDLYLCHTDSQDMVIDGRTISPEDALDELSLEDLSDYIEDGDDDIILQYISSYELDLEDHIEDVAKLLLEEGNSFADIVEAFEDSSISKE